VIVIVASLYSGLQMVRLGYNSASKQGQVTEALKDGLANAQSNATTATDAQSRAIQSLPKTPAAIPASGAGATTATTTPSTTTTPPEVAAANTALTGLSQYVDSLSTFAKSLQGLSPSLQYFLVSTILFVLAAAVALFGLRHRSG